MFYIELLTSGLLLSRLGIVGASSTLLSLLHQFIYYLLAINVITFIVYGIDKWIAIRNGKIESLHYSRPLPRGSKGRRIPEATLLILAAIGGSMGAWCGMILFRHKTKHWKFKLGVPVIFLLQFALLVYVYWKY